MSAISYLKTIKFHIDRTKIYEIYLMIEKSMGHFIEEN